MKKPIFTIYLANCRGNETNCLYPHKIDVVDRESLIKAVSRYYVCAKFKNSYRSCDNFEESNCCGTDVDNEHSDDPKDWITPADLSKALLWTGTTSALSLNADLPCRRNWNDKTNTHWLPD